MSDEAAKILASAIAVVGVAWALVWAFVRSVQAIECRPSETSKILEHYREQDRKEGKP